MKRSILVFSITMAAIGILRAQHTNVLISITDAPNEPSIMLNPKNPQQMVAGANLNNVYLSQDGGLTWSESHLNSSLGVWGDPTIAVDSAGSFYFLHLSNPPSGNWIDRIVCQKMDTFNTSWSDGSFMGLNGAKAQDKQWPAVDLITNTIYVTWTQFDEYGSTDPLDSSIIMFSKSIDAGLTWSPAVRISKLAGDCIDSDSTTEGAVPAIGPNGEVYVAWAGPGGLMFDRSTDGGNTWLDEDIYVSDIPGGWDYPVPAIFRCNGLPITCCDISTGLHRGNIYINWTDQRNGETNTDVWLSRSTDGGNSWSAPIRVNDDTSMNHQFFSWMTIDQATGKIWLVWYDRRNYDDDRTDVYMAVSEDGGQTFTNFKVSESPFLANENVFFGDYTNITAHNNVVRPIWGRCDNYDQSIYTAIVDPVAIGQVEKETMVFEVSDIYPNPGTDLFAFSYKLHRSSEVKISVYDATGRLAALISSGKEEPGRHICRISSAEFDLQSGIYYVRLENGEYTKTQMFVISR